MKKQLLSMCAALVVAGTLVSTATSSDAQTPQAYYVAVPEAQPTDAHLVTRTAAWAKAGNAYLANRAPERPEILCQLVAGKTGALSSFSVNGEAFTADKLAKCNAKVAKSAPQVASTTK